ncbi:MAG: DUF262 domain-containing protein [Candidatus Staskawiczbacteria bacterium]|nr:DUF262 domain-containing protein [Candidatus Staskawiczbacteria bacterium]
MEAKETNFLRFLNRPMQLTIPIYQRTYSWKIKECEQLWKDIIKAGKDENISGHFVGSIVYVEKGIYQVSALPRLLVIDGQQRLTTLSLLVLALCNHIKKNNIQTDINPEKLLGYYLLNAQEDGEEKYKLILTQTDKTSYIKLLDNLDHSDKDSLRIKENYQFFKEKIASEDLSTLYKGISKLIIIDVSLDREKDNPQLIFESLNSTGLELTQADLVRNYILMGLENQRQKDLYQNYWYPMEKSFGHSENTGLFDRFMRDYLTIKLGRIPTIKEIYTEFKQYSQKFKDINELVKDVFEYSKYFVNVALDKEPDNEIKEAFLDINELKVDVSYPFILSIYKDYVNEKISKDELIKILKLIESYVFRRAICGVQTNSLNKTFSTLYKQIDQENYLESTQALIVLQDSYRRLPDDDEFKRELVIKDTYNFRNRNYILRKLENFERKEKVDVESYTIEHIMPQNPNLSEEWKKELGEKWKEIQKAYLHTIGNLTLTGYNSEYQDKPFKEKRDLKDKNGLPIGFKDSPIRLNRLLATLENWNEEKIKERAGEISKQTINIWVYPKLEATTLDKYRKEESGAEKQTYTIEDHKHLQEGEPMRPIFEELRKRILNIDSSVREEPQKLYVAYKSITNFVDIVPQKRALSLRINIPFDKVNDPIGKCRDISEMGKWGNGDTELKISNIAEIEYALKIIKQAFDNVTGANDDE